MTANASRDRGLALLDELVAEGAQIVSAREVRRRLGISAPAASNLLRRLTYEGLLERLRPGWYAVRGLGVMGTTSAAESLAIAVGAGFGDTTHRIGYRSALDELDLLTHPARTVHVAAAKRVRLSHLSGRPLRVVIEPVDKIYVGAMRDGPSWVSGIERALLDAARRPELVGGAPTLVEALASAGEQVDSDRLTEYAGRLGWGSALRRIGSVADRLEIPSLAGQLKPLVPPKADLDLELTEIGNVVWRDRRWWVRWHRDVEELRSVLDQ